MTISTLTTHVHLDNNLGYPNYLIFDGTVQIDGISLTKRN